jgi:hypothetical protein
MPPIRWIINSVSFSHSSKGWDAQDWSATVGKGLLAASEQDGRASEHMWERERDKVLSRVDDKTHFHKHNIDLFMPQCPQDLTIS